MVSKPTRRPPACGVGVPLLVLTALTNSESAWFDAAYALAQLGEPGVLPLMRGLMSTNSDVRRASAAGLAWRNSLPVPQTGPPLKMVRFMMSSAFFSSKGEELSQRFYEDGEATAFLPVVSPYTQSTNAEVREAAVFVTNRLGQLPPHVKQPIPYPLVPRYAETM